MKTTTTLLLLAFITLSFMDIPPTFEEKVTHNFTHYKNLLPKEKVYLHTDKDIYRAGENIWFRAYLVDAVTNVPFIASRYVYVELTDRQDSLVQRIKVVEMDSIFQGNLKIPTDILQGDYCLRAFTYWMQNDGPDYFFKKNIRILNPKEAKLNTDVTYTPQADGTTMATIKITDAQKYIMARQTFLCQLNEADKRGSFRSMKTDADGIIRLKVKPGIKSIYLGFRNDKPFEFGRYLYVPESSDDFDVQFFPESGSLLAGTHQKVAFKAIGKDGMSQEVSGSLYIDSVPVAKLSTQHKGMGYFILPVIAGNTYSAVIRNKEGKEKTFPLPPIVENGIGIQLSMTDSTIRYQLVKSPHTQFTNELYIVLHSRGQIISVDPIVNEQPCIVDKRLLPEGIAHLAVIDSTNKIYAQRIFFIPPKRQPQFTISTNKALYKNREKVEVDLSSLSGEMDGSFSISVTDSTTLNTDLHLGNIFSNLLLTSDLKGYIEEPTYYFSDTAKNAQEHLDLVMLTHGWTRFNVADIVARTSVRPPFYLERGQAISGKIENYWNKDAPNAQLMLIGDNGYAGMISSDENGRFIDDRLAFRDSTRFIARALNHKGKERVIIKFDQDQFLPISNFFPYNPTIKVQDDDFYKKFYQNFYYENGEKIYVLNEVNIIQKVSPKKYTQYDNWVDDHCRFDSARIAAIEEFDILKILDQLPGVMVVGRRVLPDGEYQLEGVGSGSGNPNEKTPANTKANIPIYVNGFEETSITFVEWLQKKDLLGISLLKGSIAETNFKAKQVILITTVPGHQLMKPRLVLNVARIRPLGVSLPDEFYVPRYDIDSVRNNGLTDDRTTLYWNPEVRLVGSNPMRLSFYTGDTKSTYSITLEGITRKGTLCRKTVTMKTGE